MERGTVKWFNRVTEFGFIEQEDGEDLFVRKTAVEGTIADGDVVEFEVGEDQKGPIAVNVRKVAKEHSTVLESILRVIAEDVFQSISSFRFNPKKDNGRLEIGTPLHSQRREFYYDNLQSKSWRDIQAEMKEDRKSPPLRTREHDDRKASLIDVAEVLTRFRCVECDTPMEGGPYKGTNLCPHCGLMFDSKGNAINPK